MSQPVANPRRPGPSSAVLESSLLLEELDDPDPPEDGLLEDELLDEESLEPDEVELLDEDELLLEQLLDVEPLLDEELLELDEELVELDDELLDAVELSLLPEDAGSPPDGPVSATGFEPHAATSVPPMPPERSSRNSRRAARRVSSLFRDPGVFALSGFTMSSPLPWPARRHARVDRAGRPRSTTRCAGSPPAP